MISAVTASTLPCPQATHPALQAALAAMHDRLEASITRECRLLALWVRQRDRLATLQGENAYLRHALQVQIERADCLQQVLTTAARWQEVGV